MHYNAYSAVRALNALETEGCQIGSLSPAPSPRAQGKLLPRANLTETITPEQSRREAMVVVARPSAPNTSECARGLGLRTRASLVFGHPPRVAASSSPPKHPGCCKATSPIRCRPA